MSRSLSHAAAAAAMALFPGITATAPTAAFGIFHPPVHLLGTRNGSVSSTNWSGYAVQSSSEFTEATGSWVQPTATCTELLGRTYAAFWVGLDGYSSSSVEQLGTDSDCAGRNSPSYYAWYEMYPAASVDLSTSTYPVKPGDTLTATVSRSGDSYTLSLKSSRGWSFSSPQTGSDANASAEWIAEAPEICSFFCSNAQLTNFGAVAFSGSEAAIGAGAEPISSFTYDGGPQQITMTTSTGTTRAKPGALTSNGEGFTDTWAHN